MKNSTFFIWLVCAMFTFGHIMSKEENDDFIGGAIFSMLAWPTYWGVFYRHNNESEIDSD